MNDGTVRTAENRGHRVVSWAIALLRQSFTILPRTIAALACAVVGRPEAANGHLRAIDPSATGELPADLPADLPGAASAQRALAVSLLLLPVGVLAFLDALFATLDELRVLFLYPWTDGGTIGPGTWGGPTLAGAWLVHALLGIVLLPVFVGVMVALTRLSALAVRPTGVAPRWVVPVTVLVDVAAVLFLIAFVRQL